MHTRNHRTSTMAGARVPDKHFDVHVYKPTSREIVNFTKMIEHLHTEGFSASGLAKIIPPRGFLARSSGYGGVSDDKFELQSNIGDIEIQTALWHKFVECVPGVYRDERDFFGNISISDFKETYDTGEATGESPEDIENEFWREITSGRPVYAVDIPGTLFEDEDRCDLNDLETILSDLVSECETEIEGVTSPYLYVGLQTTAFCWHTEDQDLYSINYLHTGAPKQWYCIPPECGLKFERLAASLLPKEHQKCSAFLRHKNIMITPETLDKHQIPYVKTTQYAGEFIITFPYAYHAGFNHGFNIAEAVNFATEHWIDYGKNSTRCMCRTEQAAVPMQPFVKKYQPARYNAWIKGEDSYIDPRKPYEPASPAPKPTDYQLYVLGNHERSLEDRANAVGRTRLLCVGSRVFVKRVKRKGVREGKIAKVIEKPTLELYCQRNCETYAGVEEEDIMGHTDGRVYVMGDRVVVKWEQNGRVEIKFAKFVKYDIVGAKYKVRFENGRQERVKGARIILSSGP